MSHTKPVVTIELLNRLKSARGGYSRASLEYLGIGWPPKRGWRKELIREASRNQMKLQVERLTPETVVDAIKCRFIVLAPQERLKLLESLRETYCFLCGRMKPCECEY